MLAREEGEEEKEEIVARSIRYSLDGILQAWPARILQAVGCLTCQVNRRQPRTIVSRVPLRRYPRSAVSASRVLIRDIIPVEPGESAGRRGKRERERVEG